MCPWGKCPGGTCPGGFCPVTDKVMYKSLIDLHLLLSDGGRGPYLVLFEVVSGMCRGVLGS